MGSRGGLISLVDGPDEFRAAAMALRAAPRDLRNQINRNMTATLSPVWIKEVNVAAFTSLERALIVPGTRIKAGSPPTLIAANSRKKLARRPGALIPAEHWHAAEYGANRGDFTNYRRRSPQGTPHDVRRRVKTGLPKRNKTGHVLGPAMASVGPRLASMFVQTVVRTYMDILNPKD